MTSQRELAALACTLALLAGCSSGDSTGPAPLPSAQCSIASLQTIAVGTYRIIDPLTQGSCIRVPSAGPDGAEYLYAALATEGEETPSGVEASYALDGGLQSSPSIAPYQDVVLAPFRPPTSANAFHGRLRAQERALSQSPAAAAAAMFGLGASQAAAMTPPVVGHQRNFFVCRTPTCSTFDETTATAKHVGQRVAIYVDDAAPTEAEGGYSQADLDRVGALFDNYLYPIDTVAFGRESDIDNNGVVIVLLTPQVNELSPNCNVTNSVILGYFFSLDLLPTLANSNAGEVFYGIVPDPDNAACSISTSYANRNLPPVFIHELQHMISYNQHVRIKGGISEDVWLNEGLSHFAEELGGWKIPDAECTNNDCLTQFALNNVSNAYAYLGNPEAHYLVEPGASGGTLEERGANWLFVRWFADQFDTDTDGKNVTRQLVGTDQLGAANVAAVAGESFATLVSLWQMANYLDDLPNFVPTTSRLRYDRWNFRDTFGSLHDQAPGEFPNPYPLIPDVVTMNAYAHSGVLRAGSGRHLRIVQPASSGSIELRFTASDEQSLPPAEVAPRIALIRIR